MTAFFCGQNHRPPEKCVSPDLVLDLSTRLTTVSHSTEAYHDSEYYHHRYRISLEICSVCIGQLQYYNVCRTIQQIHLVNCIGILLQLPSNIRVKIFSKTKLVHGLNICMKYVLFTTVSYLNIMSTTIMIVTHTIIYMIVD